MAWLFLTNEWIIRKLSNFCSLSLVLITLNICLHIFSLRNDFIFDNKTNAINSSKILKKLKISTEKKIWKKGKNILVKYETFEIV